MSPQEQEDFKELVDGFDDTPREPRIIRVDPKLRNVDIDAFDDLLSEVKAPARRAVRSQKAPAGATRAQLNKRVNAILDGEFDDLLDDAALEMARRMAEWEPQQLVLGYQKLTCSCCGEVHVQQLGIFIREQHKRTGSLHFTAVNGRINDWHTSLPRVEDVICESSIPECQQCFMLGTEHPEQLPLDTDIPAPPQVVRILEAVFLEITSNVPQS